MVERLYIEGTKGTPKVDLNPCSNLLIINGQSYPENAFKFYEPIFQWVDLFLEALDCQTQVEIDFCFPYINTSSSKCVMMLLEKFDEAYKSGKKLRLCWHYDAENDSELECAEEFKEDIFMPFDIISGPIKDRFA